MLTVLCVCVFVCESVHSPQPQTAQALTNLRTHFYTLPRRSAAPALVGASQGSTKRRKEEKEGEAASRKSNQYAFT